MASLELNIKQVNSDFNGIKNAIVANGVEIANGTATSEYADKVNEVYEKGKQAENDAFWDYIQEKGNRTDYGYAFAGVGMKHQIFYPKYSMQPIKCFRMFYNWLSGIQMDIVERFAECGITLDFSKSVDMADLFMFSLLSRVGIVDATSAPNVNQCFSWCRRLHTIDKLILKADGTQSLTNTFYNCQDLKNITIEGVFGYGVSFAESTLLSKASIQSVFSCLSDTASGMTLTLSTTAVNKAFETASGMADGSTSEEWLNLVATKPNWTISLS